MLKRLMRGPAALAVGGLLIAAYIRLMFATSRWRTIGGEATRAMWAANQPFIGAFWHGRMLAMAHAWRVPRPMHVLISHHRDGEVIARAMGHFGHRAVRGSSASKDRDKGGPEALRALVRLIKAGEYVCVTPDGPRGPRMRAAPGVVWLAKLARVPIVPATFACTRRRVLNTWDRFVVALPFSRGVFIIGEPIAVAADADDQALERARLAVENELNRITAEADRLCGFEPLAPAAPQMTAPQEKIGEHVGA
jgi:lysophospholipid acyltransferase (LPLAT)-like uncharacterized protein